MKLSDVVEQLLNNSPTQPLDEGLFRQLFSSSWKLLDHEERQIVLSTPLFWMLPSIRCDALTATSGVGKAFKKALVHLVQANLLEEDNSGNVLVHPLVRAFAQMEFDQLADESRAEMRSRALTFYLEFIQEHVVRKRPLVLPPYWNALVCRSMEILDPEWSAIENLMQWALNRGSWESVIKFVMLSVHYMDSRFRNDERLKYVHAAADSLKNAGRERDEALLRIDALGWTYIEEGRPGEAKVQINEGFKIARRLDDQDLMALAYSWLARLATTAGDVPTATASIQVALGMKTSQWIWYRVNMAAGDIAYSEARFEVALQFYQTAQNQVMEYGGEEGYQIETRLGLAWAGLGKLEEAERTLARISGLNEIAVGQLHAKYGMAVVEKKRGNAEKAQQLANEVRQSLNSRTKSSLLLAMTEKLLKV